MIEIFNDTPVVYKGIENSVNFGITYFFDSKPPFQINFKAHQWEDGEHDTIVVQGVFVYDVKTKKLKLLDNHSAFTNNDNKPLSTRINLITGYVNGIIPTLESKIRELLTDELLIKILVDEKEAIDRNMSNLHQKYIDNKKRLEKHKRDIDKEIDKLRGFYQPELF